MLGQDGIHITLNIAAIPFLWVIPLALYLLSFILVFARVGSRPSVMTIDYAPDDSVLAILTLMPSGSAVRFWIIILLHLATLFVVALVCHGELARTRPPVTHLTIFYLLMSIGGALGGTLLTRLSLQWFLMTSSNINWQFVLQCLSCPMRRRVPHLKKVDGTRFDHHWWCGTISPGLSSWSDHVRIAVAVKIHTPDALYSLKPFSVIRPSYRIGKSSGRGS